jgi:hypothetical protein
MLSSARASHGVCRDYRLPSPVKILYIVGFPRSGSTLLDQLLAADGGLVSAGEVRRIWERGFLANELCGCGQPFGSCPFWTRVVDEAFGGPGGVDARAMASAIAALDGRRARWIEVGRRIRPFAGSAPNRLDEVLLPLYRAILTISGAPAIVDSSKDSTYALLLSTIEGIEVEIVHLVRDSRAVAYSWQRRRRRPEIVDREEYMPVIRPAGAAAGWSARNVSAEALRRFSQRYVRLRYEDLVADPGMALPRVLGDLQPAPRAAGLSDGGRRPGLHHTVSGNPMRLAKGPLKVTPDVEWMSAMNGRDRTAVTALSSPLLLRYGYRLFPGRTPAATT